MEPTTKMTKEEKLKAIKKYLKDNWVEILIYFILLGGFVTLAITNTYFSTQRQHFENEKSKNQDNVELLNYKKELGSTNPEPTMERKKELNELINKLEFTYEIEKYTNYVTYVNYPIYFLTGLNLLFTPHKLYGTAKQPIKNICIKIHRKRKKIGVITER